MKFILFSIFFLGASALFAQIKPEIFPEDVSIDEIQTRCYCKPGVRNKSRSRGLELSYGFVGPGRYKEQSTPFTGRETTFQNFQNFKIDTKIPLILIDKFKLLLAYKFTAEHYNYNIIGPDFKETFMRLEEETLKNNSLSIIASKPLNETKYLVFRIGYAANGNYNKFASIDSEYAIYKFTSFYGIKPNDDLEYGFGLNLSESFRRFNILPFFLYNRTFNSNWGIEAVLPAYAFARYNVADNYIFLMGFEYGSKSYRLIHDIPGTIDFNDYAYNHSELIASLEIEHKFFPWFWGHVNLGYNLNFSSQFEAKNNFTEDFDIDPTNNFYIHFGLFISPPNM